MNKKEIAEIRRRFDPEREDAPCIRGCYVNNKREIISTFCQPLVGLPQEEAEKYMSIFKRALSGAPGKNLVDIVFSTDQVGDSDEHRLLMALRDAEPNDEEVAEALYRRVIDSLEMEDNYLIVLLRDAYDVPFRARDDMKIEDLSEEVFQYVVCAICPVKLSKPALTYIADENEFHARDMAWVVGAPELGFMFPAFDDRSSNIYNALYYTRDTAVIHDEFVTAMFKTQSPMSPDAQKETFQSILADALADDCRYEVVQTVHEQLRDMLEEQKSDKEAEPLTISKREVRAMLENCGVSESHVAAFEEKYDEEFGEGAGVTAVNLVDSKQFEVRTPNVTIRVAPEHSGMIETRVIDGVKYILVRVDEGVEVNGVGISI